MRTLIAVASLAALLAACGDNPAPSTSDPDTIPSDGVTDPAPAGQPGSVATTPPPAPAGGEQGGGSDWRQIASTADAANLGRLDQAWRLGRAEAEDKGFASQVEALGPLVDPMAGQAGRLQPSPGTYRCRTIKLGAKTPGMLEYVGYPAFICRIGPDGALQSFAKMTGSQRQVGLIFPGDAIRKVFFGTVVLGDERRALQYGRDQERDVAGFVERIGPNRWRLLMPRPHFESQIDVLELIPSG